MDKLLPEFRRDKRYILLIVDCGFAITEGFENKINMGVREQATISIAAGMAMGGLKPVVYSIAAFLIFRALEQIRLDLVKQNIPVKLIGYGAGNETFAHLGYSHTTGSEDAEIAQAIGLPVFSAPEFSSWLHHPGPAYLRLT